MRYSLLLRHSLNLLRFCTGAPTPSLGPLRVQWDVTSRCNSKCAHCHRWQSNQSSEDLSHLDAVRLIGQLAEAGTISLSFAGNEPLLREDIFDLIEVAAKARLVTNLNTNAWLLDDRAAARLVAAGLDMIYISVDGANPETYEEIRGVKGGFERAWEAIVALRRARGTARQPRIMVNLVANRKNYREIMAVADLCRQHGVDGLLVQPVHNVEVQFEANADLTFDETQLSALGSEMRALTSAYRDLVPLTNQYYDHFATFYRAPSDLYRYRCLAAFAAADIRPNGDVMPCPVWNHSLGNVLEAGSFQSVWYSEKARATREAIARGQHPVCWMACIVPLNLIVHDLRSGRLDRLFRPRLLTHIIQKLVK